MAADRTVERYAWLSLAAAVVTIALKTWAWYEVLKAIALTHIEPIFQPASYEDIELER
jgi:hypothetical protein